MVGNSCEGYYILVEGMELPEGTLIRDYTKDECEEAAPTSATTVVDN